MPLPSLYDFLHTYNLSQYYDAFIRSGATDRDLQQILEFNDTELNEILQAVGMLPFHRIGLKRALRELKDESEKRQPHENDSASLGVFLASSSREVIVSHAAIYGKKKSRSLTDYEVAINQAAAQLALDDPSLLTQKGRLFELAKQKLLEEGFQYKRGQSRSKFNTNKRHATNRGVSRSGQQNSNDTSRRNLRAQRLSEERRAKMSELQQKLMRIMEQQRHQPRKVDDFMQLEQSRIELTKEISKLRAQERKHQWYENRKARRVDSGFSEEADEEADKEESQNEGEDEDENEAGDEDEDEDEGIAMFEREHMRHAERPKHSEIRDIHRYSTTFSIGTSTFAPRESDVRAHTLVDHRRKTS